MNTTTIHRCARAFEVEARRDLTVFMRMVGKHQWADLALARSVNFAMVGRSMEGVRR